MTQVLDHGYLKVIETWGCDEGIIEAARMSTSKGFQGWGFTCDECGWAQGQDHEVGCTRPEKWKPGDEKLLRYLWKNKHSTPFEMAGATIEVQAPIFVFREWHRHRTQCLAGDTMIACVSPRGTTYQRSIKSIFDLKYGGVEDGEPKTKNGRSRAGTSVVRAARRKTPWRTRVLPNCQSRTLRVLNEETGDFDVAAMADVWEAGVKPVYLLTTDTGRTIKASAEHPFYCRFVGPHTTGFIWEKLKDLKVGTEIARMGKVPTSERVIPPALRAGIGVWTSMMRSRLIKPVDDCYLCGARLKEKFLALDHVVPVVENLLRALDETNLKPVCERCHRNKTNAEQPNREGMTKRGVRWERVASVRLLDSEMTYDIEVGGPHHNYVANGLVVHNSYSELSARYTPLPDVNYVPSIDRLLMNAHSANKQAGTAAGAKVLTARSAEAYQKDLRASYLDAEALYRHALSSGVPKELARVHIPVGRYSRMRASANLRNWIGFLTLREAPGAQWEIRQYAHALFSALEARFPRTLALYAESRP